MKIFSDLLSVLFFFVSVAHGFGNLTFPAPYLLEILRTDPPADISEICKEHLSYFTERIGDEVWAMQMFDSITKFPDGIFLGRSHFPGHFDECVETRNEKFEGKHCMLQVSFKKESIHFTIPKKSAEGLAKRTFHYGICVPSTCSAKDIENAIKNVQELNFMNVALNETHCSTKGYRAFRDEDWVTVCFIIVIVIIAILSTVYDLYHRYVIKTENPSQLWTSFSIYTTGKQLFSISQSTSQLKCLHGIRFLSMSWVILAHAYFSFLFASAINFRDAPKIMNDRSFTPVSNGFVSVDSFFFLSGLLVCLVFFRDISRKGSYDVPVGFLHRYVRLTPPYAILTLIQATIISRIGNGPFWNSAVDAVENNCRRGWWTGMLYLQNYLRPQDVCLGQAWYLSADMQMYWVSPLILYPLLWFPSYAPFFLGILVLVASLTNFTIAYVNKLQPNLLVKMFSGDSFIGDQFKLEYTPFHTRMAPWLIGLATGYIICGIQANKIKIRLSKFWTVCGWVAAITLLGGTIFSIVRFFPEDIFQPGPDNYTETEAALYLAFHRVGWALGLAWVVIACVSGHGGPINSFLSLDFFQPLAKLSYCNFLTHMTLQNYRMNSSRTNQYLRHFEVVYSYFGDLIFSHLISIPIALLFEFSFGNLDRHFLRKLVIFPFPKKKLHKKETETEKPEKSEVITADVEEGKTNPAFNET